METPDLSHFSANDYERLYEPAEDSFLLLDALEADLAWLRGAAKPWLCLEIGCGSGIISAAISNLPHGPLCFATDISNFACQAAPKTARPRLVETVESDLSFCFQPRLGGKVDLLVFNPPYVPTDDDEVQVDTARRWAGGENGRRVIDRLLPDVHELLSPGGRFYLVALAQNDPSNICEVLNRSGLDSSVFLTRRCGIEILNVVRAVKPSSR
ncbi:unnamed protein product [Notodromas monacha]|uniref:Methyltransferase HEMK2 n=1 Tax=Notodromas monacha TaxID=399045 RepID=A0A7R9BTF5_9CRUS|nr:unnamed protein product [Notodromas monacha]CAG0919880.1 unnamed protein product [Notodromas monacha]